MRASLAFVNGTVVTNVDAEPVTDAVAVCDGVIVAVGHDDVTASLDGTTEVIDLARRCVLPAFRDGHAHPMHGGHTLRSLDLPHCDTLDEILEAVGAWAHAHPGLDWIVGYDYQPAILPGGHGHAEWLDRVCPDRPVALYPTDHHAVWLNTEALRRVGVDAATPDPPLGTIVRHADGSPVGTLLEFGGTGLVEPYLPVTTTAEFGLAIDRAMIELASLGIVWVQDASLSIDELAPYVDAARAGRLTTRVNAALRAMPDEWRTQLDAFVAAREAYQVGTDFTIGTVKFFADGVIEHGTGFLLEPYVDAPHTCGLPNWGPAELAEAVAAFDAVGFQCHIHAIGDGGVRMSLDAFEHAARRNGTRDRRPVVAHTQLVHPDDRPRFAALGVVANFEPLWACIDECQEQLTFPRLGPERSTLQYPIASVAQHGAHVSFGSDWPVTTPDPLQGLAVAVTRRNRRGEPVGGWTPDERLPAFAAIAAATAGTAYQAFDDLERGAVTVGRRADLALLDADVTTIDGHDLRDVRVVGTWADGRAIHRVAD